MATRLKIANRILTETKLPAFIFEATGGSAFDAYKFQDKVALWSKAYATVRQINQAIKSVPNVKKKLFDLNNEDEQAKQFYGLVVQKINDQNTPADSNQINKIIQAAAQEVHDDYLPQVSAVTITNAVKQAVAAPTSPPAKPAAAPQAAANAAAPAQTGQQPAQAPVIPTRTPSTTAQAPAAQATQTAVVQAAQQKTIDAVIKSLTDKFGIEFTTDQKKAIKEFDNLLKINVLSVEDLELENLFESINKIIDRSYMEEGKGSRKRSPQQAASSSVAAPAAAATPAAAEPAAAPAQTGQQNATPAAKPRQKKEDFTKFKSLSGKQLQNKINKDVTTLINTQFAALKLDYKKVIFQALTRHYNTVYAKQLRVQPAATATATPPAPVDTKAQTARDDETIGGVTPTEKSPIADPDFSDAVAPPAPAELDKTTETPIPQQDKTTETPIPQQDKTTETPAPEIPEPVESPAQTRAQQRQTQQQAVTTKTGTVPAPVAKPVAGIGAYVGDSGAHTEPFALGGGPATDPNKTPSANIKPRAVPAPPAPYVPPKSQEEKEADTKKTQFTTQLGGQIWQWFSPEAEEELRQERDSILTNDSLSEEEKRIKYEEYEKKVEEKTENYTKLRNDLVKFFKKIENQEGTLVISEAQKKEYKLELTKMLKEYDLEDQGRLYAALDSILKVIKSKKYFPNLDIELTGEAEKNYVSQGTGVPIQTQPAYAADPSRQATTSVGLKDAFKRFMAEEKTLNKNQLFRFKDGKFVKYNRG